MKVRVEKGDVVYIAYHGDASELYKVIEVDGERLKLQGISADNNEPEFWCDSPIYIHKPVYEAFYIEEADKTVIFTQILDLDGVCIDEIVSGFYYGEPNDEDTAYYAHKGWAHYGAVPDDYPL